MELKSKFLHSIRLKQYKGASAEGSASVREAAGITESDWQIVQFFVLWLVFLLWLVFPFMVFPYKVYCKRQHMLQIFRHFCFCVTTVKFLQSLRLFEIFLLNYCSAGVTELHYILILCETKHYLNTIPHYTLS